MFDLAASLWRLGALLALAVVLGGCAVIVSVHPVVSELEAGFDPRLLGTWEEIAGSETDKDLARVVVSRASENLYALEVTDRGMQGKFEARLGRLGDRLILDAWPSPRQFDRYDDGLLITGHLLLLLDLHSDEVRVSGLDEKPFTTALGEGRIRLAHERSSGQLILHGTTDALRAALAPYVADARGWMQPRRIRRVPVQAAAAPPVAIPCFKASPWREADQLFHRDPHWVGADGASSVDLGGGRTLWLFGDTWIDPTGHAVRRGARMVSNSIAIQTGTDPSTAAIAFHWGRAADGSPAPFFADRGTQSLWPGHGVRLGDKLVLFFARVLRNTGTGLGFESAGWAAVMVENPDDEPSAWRFTPVKKLTDDELGVLVGYAAIVQIDGYVVALGAQDPVKSHPIFAVRWPADKVRSGDLTSPQWWAGERLGWVDATRSIPRWPLFENGQTEMSVHLDPATQRFVAVQTQGFGASDVMMRAAPTLTGPWSQPQAVYRPAEYRRPKVLIYAAKAHPQLGGADLVLTYATNTSEFAEQLTDSHTYYPHFVRLARCK